MDRNSIEARRIKDVISESLGSECQTAPAHVPANGSPWRSLGSVLFVFLILFGSVWGLVWAHWHVRDNEILLSVALAYGVVLYCIGQIAEYEVLPRLFRLVRPIGWIMIGLTMICTSNTPWKRWWGQDLLWPEGVLSVYALAFFLSAYVVWKKRDWSVFPLSALLYGAAFYCSPLGSAKFGVLLANMIVIVMVFAEVRHGQRLHRTESVVFGYILLGCFFLSGISSLYFRPVERWLLFAATVAVFLLSRERSVKRMRKWWNNRGTVAKVLAGCILLGSLVAGSLGTGVLRHSHGTVLENGKIYRFGLRWLGEPKNAVAGKRLPDVRFDLEKQWVSRKKADEAYDFKDTPVYLVIDKVEEGGFVTDAHWEYDPPAEGIWFRTGIDRIYAEDESPLIVLDFPFGEYLLNEMPNAPAEQVFWSMSESQCENSWMEVAILDGQAVPRQLYLDGKRAEDFLRNAVVE